MENRILNFTTRIKEMETLNVYKNAIWFNIKKFIKWIVLGSIVGIIVGLVAAAFAHCLTFANTFRNNNAPILFLLPVGGLLIVFLYKRFHYEYNHGTDDVIENLHTEVKVPLKMSFLIFISTVITVICGGSVGREGAALQIGGSIGSQIGKWFKFCEEDKKIMLMCGMAAAFSGLFGTPIAAVFFSMEVASVGIMYYAALVPCICASLIANQLVGLLGVEAEHFPVIAEEGINIVYGGKVILLAICCALLSILFCKALQAGKKLYKKYIPNPYIRIMAGGFLVIALTYIIGSRDYLGTGMNIVEQALEGEALPLAFLLKMLFTVVTITAGYKGGEIVPSFFIGATFGCVFGQLIGLPAAFTASLGMIGVFCGVTNCPIASLLIGFELFGYHNAHYLLIVTAISYMLSGNYSLYHKQKIMYSKLELKKAEK